MLEITQNSFYFGLTILSAVLLAQSALAIYMAFCLRIASRERARINKELFGLVKRIEGLTSNRREQMLKQYDKILANLAVRLPTIIAANAGHTILETENKILTRLAELEPNLKTDENGRKKMDELIRSMENLEQTIVALTAETVRQVMVDSRSDLLEDENFSDVSLAA